MEFNVTVHYGDLRLGQLYSPRKLIFFPGETNSKFTLGWSRALPITGVIGVSPPVSLREFFCSIIKIKIQNLTPLCRVTVVDSKISAMVFQSLIVVLLPSENLLISTY